MGATCTRGPQRNQSSSSSSCPRTASARAVGSPNVDGRPGSASSVEVAGPDAGLCNSCFEPVGAQTSEHWAYVGPGRGGYEKVRDGFIFVGTGSGGYKKDVPTQSSCRVLRVCCTAVVFCAGLAFLYVLRDPIAKVAHHGRDAAEELLMQQKGPTDNAGAAAIGPPSRSNTSNQSRWQWKNASLPCPDANSTSPQGPPPPRPTGKAGGSAAEVGAGGEGQAWPVPGDTARVKLEGCDTLCEYQGQASTCRFRIQWAATHRFLWRHGACRQGYEAVLRMCPSCSSCALAGSGCVTPAPTTRKPPTTASAGGAVGASP